MQKAKKNKNGINNKIVLIEYETVNYYDAALLNQQLRKICKEHAQNKLNIKYYDVK